MQTVTFAPVQSTAHLQQYPCHDRIERDRHTRDLVHQCLYTAAVWAFTRFTSRPISAIAERLHCRVGQFLPNVTGRRYIADIISLSSTTVTLHAVTYMQCMYVTACMHAYTYTVSQKRVSNFCNSFNQYFIQHHLTVDEDIANSRHHVFMRHSVYSCMLSPIGVFRGL